jgi:hypothetical protein
MRSPPRAQQYVRGSQLVGGETNAAIKTRPGLPARRFEEAWRRYLDDEEQEHEPSKSVKILCLRGD